MAIVEVDEAELLNLKGLQTTMSRIMANPDARKHVLQGRKIVEPNAVIPELDAAQPVLDEIAKVRAEQADFMKKMADEKAEREANERLHSFKSSWDAAKNRVRNDYPHFNDEAIGAIEKMAEERGIPDFEAAAALFHKQNPPPTPEAPQGGNGGWNFFEAPAQGDEKVKNYIEAQMKSGGDDDRALDAIIKDTLQEVRGQRRAA